MNHLLKSIRKSVNWGGKPISLLMIAALILALLPAASPPATALRAQPILLQMAAESPEQTVSVIVQKTAASIGAEDMVAALGGVVTKDLHIINAFAAEMSARAALELARSASVRWVSLDAPVVRAAATETVRDEFTAVPYRNYFLDTLGVRQAWNLGLNGNGIGVAVIDSGISPDQDFSSVRRSVSFSTNSSTVNDVYGHGTHVAGIIAGNGTNSAGLYVGIAPGVDLLSLKIADDAGQAYESDTVAAIQWVLDNKARYNIRVVNLSVNSAMEQSYHTSPLDAAVEILWFNKIVVVVSAGNNGSGGAYNTTNAAPANDPFIITVGASDEKGTASRSDDVTASYSAYGTTTNGFAKPDLIAPGTNIHSVLSKQSPWCAQYPNRAVLFCKYFRLSGTSMAAPMVAGAVALLLQDEPNLTPDQVKYRLLNTGSVIQGSSSDINPATGQIRTYPYLDVYAAIAGNTTQSANTGLPASQMLTTGSGPINSSVNWNSVNWNSVNWNSVNWNSVNWNSVNWNSVNWNSMYWGP